MESESHTQEWFPRNLICSKASLVFLIPTTLVKNRWLWWQLEAVRFIKDSEGENNAGSRHSLRNGYRRRWVTQKFGGGVQEGGWRFWNIPEWSCLWQVLNQHWTECSHQGGHSADVARASNFYRKSNYGSLEASPGGRGSLRCHLGGHLQASGRHHGPPSSLHVTTTVHHTDNDMEVLWTAGRAG